MRSPRHVRHDNLFIGNLWVEVAASPIFFCLEIPRQDQGKLPGKRQGGSRFAITECKNQAI